MDSTTKIAFGKRRALAEAQAIVARRILPSRDLAAALIQERRREALREELEC